MRRLLATVTLSLAVAGAAHAQPSPYPQGQNPQAQYPRGQPTSGQSSQGPSSQGLGRLHDALNLSPAQEEGWRAYQNAIAQNPQQRARQQEAQMLMPTLPTPRRLALIRAQMQTDMEVFEQNARAVNAFYMSLSPEQQRIFDRETAAPAQH